ncbi:hypothetical protein I3843_11G190900 [Carya illinoinensis]|uniref:Uncharacterized protein n=1 Tax=Carya illinoinensis TaxID=32201 RepID=A0A922J1P0_CARIL|nr:hypothetical protein I3842_11G193000 [Carya illinoinensis]KAG7957751.1 hypothetical protein I3843_11G190900 [Carya illinoinensis]
MQLVSPFFFVTNLFVLLGSILCGHYTNVPNRSAKPLQATGKIIVVLLSSVC